MDNRTPPASTDAALSCQTIQSGYVPLISITRPSRTLHAAGSLPDGTPYTHRRRAEPLSTRLRIIQCRQSFLERIQRGLGAIGKV